MTGWRDWHDRESRPPYVLPGRLGPLGDRVVFVLAVVTVVFLIGHLAIALLRSVPQ